MHQGLRDDISVITRNSHNSQASKTSQGFMQRDQLVKRKELEQRLIEKYKQKYSKGNRINNYYIEKIVHDLVSKGKLNEADFQNVETKIALYSKMERPFLIDYDFNTNLLSSKKEKNVTNQFLKKCVTPSHQQSGITQLIQNYNQTSKAQQQDTDCKSQDRPFFSNNKAGNAQSQQQQQKQQKLIGNWIPVLAGQRSDTASVHSQRSRKSYSTLGKMQHTSRPMTQQQLLRLSQNQNQNQNQGLQQQQEQTQGQQYQSVPAVSNNNNNQSQQYQQQSQSQSQQPPELSISKKMQHKSNNSSLTKQYIRSLDPRKLYYNDFDMDKEIELLSEDSRPPKSVIFLDKEGADEWATLVKFDSEMYKAEQERLKQLKIEQKKKFAEDLAKQLEEKNRRKNNEKHEDQAFVKVRDEQIQYENQRQQKSSEEHKKLTLQNNQELKNQIHINKKVNRLQVKHEKLQEQDMVKKFVEECNFEQQMIKDRQMKTKNFLQSVMKESEEQQKLKKMYEQQEKFADQQQAQEYFEKMDELDKVKSNEKVSRLDKLKQQMNKWDKFKQIFEDHSKKLQENDEKIEQFLKQQDEKAKQEDQQLIIKKIKMKEEIVKELEKQIKEKKKKKDYEDTLNQLQADIWKNDTQNYYKEQQDFKTTVKSIVDENHQVLKQQMQEKEMLRKMGNMTIEELLQNKQKLSVIKDKELDQLKQSQINHVQRNLK